MIRFIPVLLALTVSLPAAELPFDRFQLDGQNAFVILPENFSPTKTTPWVLYAPTFHNKLPNHRDEGWMFDRFLAAGIAIAGIDVGESYGAPAGRTHYTALHQHLVTTKNFDPKACLLARSRGGLMLYNWAADHPEKVRCIAGIYPVCDLTSYPGLENAAPAYETDAPGLYESLELHNPTHPSRLKRLAEHRVPIYHIHGDVDKVVPLKENSQTLATNLRNLGGHATLTIAPNQGHNMWPGFFQHQPLVDFIISNATAPHLNAKPELLYSGAIFTEGPAAHPTDGTLAPPQTTKPNGILISHDGTTAYVAENNPTGDRHLLAFTINPDGTFTKKRILHDFGTGRGIDGMALDPGGVIYATAGSGDQSGIYLFNPAGALLNTIKLPGPPTNCTFGTGNNSHILYVTAQAPDNKSYALYQIDLTP